MVICLRPPVFAQPNKYLLRLSLYKIGLVSCGRNLFCTLGKGQQRRGIVPLGLYLFYFVFFVFFYLTVRTGSRNIVVFFGGHSAPDLCSVKTILAGNLRSFSVYSPEFS